MPEHESEDNEQQPQEAVTETNQPAVETGDAEEVNVAQGEANSLVREPRQTTDLSKFQQKFSHAHQSVERLQKLGEALEHSQISITELSNQLSNPESLEIQLAKTEEVTSLQQQAIAELKEKLFGQQENVKDEALRTLLSTIESFMRSQQIELAHLKAELILERAKTQTEKEQLQRELDQIYTDLESEQQQVRSLEAQIFSARSLAGSLEMQLLSAQREIEALQEKLSDRIFSLQTQEYQAQLQQWKKQCQENQQQVQHLQETLRKLLPDGSENLLELLINPQNAIEVQTISTVISEQEASTGSHKWQVDLPGFLKKPSTVQPPPKKKHTNVSNFGKYPMADLSGTWLGTYWQIGFPTRFEATLIQSGNSLSGSILDDGDLGEAQASGEVIGRNVQFTKQYLNQPYTISYTGTLSENEDFMQGQWHIGWLESGRWEARRSGENLLMELQTRQEQLISVGVSQD